MRLDVDNYQAVLDKKHLSYDYVRKAAGLSQKRYNQLLKNGFTECETVEYIADAIGCNVNEISRPDYEGCSENCIEWIRDQERATLSLSQRRTIARVKKLAAQYPDQCQIVAENKDGSVCAHIPVSWVKINPPMNLSDEQRQRIAERLNRK